MTQAALSPRPELLAAWQAEAENAMATLAGKNGPMRKNAELWKNADMMNGRKDFELSDQFMIIITCRE